MKSARLSAGGTANNRALRADTPREPYPLPAQSLRPDPLADADARLRERIALSFATVVFSLMFAIPMLLVGIILKFQ